MPRPEKVAAVAEISERIERARAVFLAEYAGLSVKQQQDLRRALKAQEAEFKVLKMTLTRRAAEGLDIEELDELLVGPTGLAFADGDPVGAAKVLKEFATANEVFAIKGGLLGRDFLTPERIGQLAEIAPREELLAMLAGAMKAPLTGLAGVLAALPRNAASIAQQLLEKKQAGEFVDAAPVADEPAQADAATRTAQAEAAEESDTEPKAEEAPEPEDGSGGSAEAADEAEPTPDAEASEVAEAEASEDSDDTAEAQAPADGSDDDETADPAEEE
jgi:large subunit ribosomal protein L10